MRICVFVLGTRAQLVKVAPVLTLACERGLEHVVWFTGQHRESIDDLIKDFDIRSEFVLPAEHSERSSIAKLLAWAPGTILKCRRYLRTTGRDRGAPLVVVHGDTLSTLLGAAAAAMSDSPVVHLESGLSSGRLFDPFPEELLRRLTFRLSDYALCPNRDAVHRMHRYRGVEVVDTGENTLLDCVRFAVREGLPASPQPYFVASIHRFQNIYNRSNLVRIVDELIAASEYSEVRFVLHPPTEQRLRKYGLMERLEAAPAMQVVPRMPYTTFLGVIAGARAVFSDGGSNQEELSYLGIPAILYRERSERPDGLGANIVLRDDLGEPLPVFIATGELDRLRRPGRIDSDARPSEVSVQALSDWASR